MKICGLQKMTLLDYPGKVACTVFLGGCDFRCPWCHNYELTGALSPEQPCGQESTAEQNQPLTPVMEEEEFLTFLDRRKGLLDGVCVTGGEPCINKELPDFLKRIREKGYFVKLDTNGAHPAMLRRILEEGLADYVAMDIKNSPGKYPLTVGLAEPAAAAAEPAPAPDKPDFAPTPDRAAALLPRIRESIALIMEKAPDYEFRTTVVEEFHSREDFEEIGKMIQGAKRYFLQPFADRDTVPYEGFRAPSEAALGLYAETARKYVPETFLRGTDKAE